MPVTSPWHWNKLVVSNHDQLYHTRPAIPTRPAVQAPIVASREPDATEAEVQKGTERSNELSAIVNNFILRRTNALLSAHLPPKVWPPWSPTPCWHSTGTAISA